MAVRSGRSEGRRRACFVLTNKSILLKRENSEGIEIPFSEITSIIERRSGALLIRSSNNAMLIPREVERRDQLRAELTQHCSITAD